MLAVTKWVIRDEKSDTAVEQCVDHCNWVYRTVSAASHAQLVPAWLARLVTRVESSRARDTAFELLERAVRPCLRIIITVILCTPRSLRPPPVYTTRSLICARPYNSVFVIDCNRGIFFTIKNRPTGNFIIWELNLSESNRRCERCRWLLSKCDISVCQCEMENRINTFFTTPETKKYYKCLVFDWITEK